MNNEIISIKISFAIQYKAGILLLFEVWNKTVLADYSLYTRSNASTKKKNTKTPKRNHLFVDTVIKQTL